MGRIILGIVLAVTSVIMLSAEYAAAQACHTTRSCAIYYFGGSCEPKLPPGGYACMNCGPWCRQCDYRTKCPTPPPNTGCSDCVGGEPINFANGNTYIMQTDVSIPGLGEGLNLTRAWNSMWPDDDGGTRIGMFGVGWRSNLEERIFLAEDHSFKYLRGDGSFWSYVFDRYEQDETVSVLAVVSPANGTVTLKSDATKWTATRKDGEKKTFDINSGSLLSISDRNGNTTQLSYDALNRLTTVTSPAGRHLYFSYRSDTSRLVSGITSDVGVTLSYTYTGNQLSRVTKPDQSVLAFEFDDHGFITGVKDGDNKVLETHTYDCLGRGLTSARANGVEAITVSYNTAPCVEGAIGADEGEVAASPQ